MSSKSCVVLAAVLLCSGFPALGQELPEGLGKELAAANCNACHTLLSRVGAGYTAEGWHTVLRMMLNQGARPCRRIKFRSLRHIWSRAFRKSPSPPVW
jgi:hypothetical protein